MNTKGKVAGIGAAAIAVVLASAGSAAAAVGFNIPDSGLVQNQKTYYSTTHTITVSGGDIEVRKTDGPPIGVSWYICGQPGTGGAWVSFQNADPTPYYVIGTNFYYGSHYCLAAWDHGTNGTDTWRGDGRS